MFCLSRTRLAGAVACALAATSTIASASARLSDSLVVYGPNGALVASAVQTEDGESAKHFSVIGTVPLDLNQLGHTTVLLEANGKWSDVFGICQFCGSQGDKNYELAFVSDTDTTSVQLNLSNPTFVPEAGPVSATKYLSLDLQAQGYTAWFKSDVPEPAAWTMMILGLGLVGAASRRLGKGEALALS